MQLDEARREYERHQKKADAARRRIDKLGSQSVALDPIAESELS